VLTASAIRAARPGPLGRTLRVIESTSSTNDDLAAAARDGAPAGTVLVADHQTGGHGRSGRSWHSPPGVNLYLSVLMRPKLATPGALPSLSLVAGLAVAEALRSTSGLDARVKWPNDVLVDGARKVAGILMEAIDASTQTPSLVVGIGLNVNERTFPPELASTATSLYLETGRTHDRAEVAAALLRHIDMRFNEASERGVEDLLSEWSAISSTLGRRVRPQDGPEGVALSVAPNGALLVRDDEGTVHEVVAGLIEES